mmetsp:Transcript_20796/g.47206  ORF Transcript_20796/g.47206 Transcript_20796/m.47206 type:complete len:203 (+) Transcript_20796:1644-2252(+)
MAIPPLPTETRPLHLLPAPPAGPPPPPPPAPTSSGSPSAWQRCTLLLTTCVERRNTSVNSGKRTERASPPPASLARASTAPASPANGATPRPKHAENDLWCLYPDWGWRWDTARRPRRRQGIEKDRCPLRRCPGSRRGGNVLWCPRQRRWICRRGGPSRRRRPLRPRRRWISRTTTCSQGTCANSSAAFGPCPGSHTRPRAM